MDPEETLERQCLLFLFGNTCLHMDRILPETIREIDDLALNTFVLALNPTTQTLEYGCEALMILACR
jgi:hypothetical protein